MKTLENKIVEMTTVMTAEGPKVEKATYSELINSCLAMPPKDGFSYDEMKKRDRIFDLVKDKTVVSINFEDADYSNLVTIVNAMRWGIMSKAIIQFTDDIINLK